MCGGGLRDFIVWFRLDGMNEVRELDRILDKEDRHIVADEIEVSFLGIKLDGEATHVPREVGRTARSDMTHMIMCMDSGINEMKSQKVSCAEAACGIS